ncbi:MarR family transcriptional regulator [Clostridium sp. MSJ-11]|uniref:MarR family transcriptional regulator n=1 Tax=Clostridium mobile TaxID=2841512 RepID=A0ABS6EFW1_9CLOT|nr:MarR family transcriptional regulator [Clostridium mobile]MBU5484032.1 MarR family transcriptional regulator [Clostridium mobile]
MLTKKEERVLNTIKRYIDDNKIPPTIRELASMLELRSTATVSDYLNRLERKGCIERIERSPRSIKIIE